MMPEQRREDGSIDEPQRNSENDIVLHSGSNFLPDPSGPKKPPLNPPAIAGGDGEPPLSREELTMQIKTRTAALYLATVLALAIVGFDMFLTVTTGHGYTAPEWAIAIIGATYLGAGANQVGGVLKALKAFVKK